MKFFKLDTKASLSSQLIRGGVLLIIVGILLGYWLAFVGILMVVIGLLVRGSKGQK